VDAVSDWDERTIPHANQLALSSSANRITRTTTTNIPALPQSASQRRAVIFFLRLPFSLFVLSFSLLLVGCFSPPLLSPPLFFLLLLSSSEQERRRCQPASCKSKQGTIDAIRSRRRRRRRRRQQAITADGGGSVVVDEKLPASRRGGTDCTMRRSSAEVVSEYSTAAAFCCCSSSFQVVVVGDLPGKSGLLGWISISSSCRRRSSALPRQKYYI